MRRRTDFDVVIAGGGPVGCALSIALSNYGIDHAIVERSWAPFPLPRAVVLDAELQRAFIHHGFGDGLAPLLTAMRAADYADAAGTRLSGIDFAGLELFGGLAPSSLFHQPDLETLLHREVIERGATLISGVSFCGVETVADGVSLRLDDGTSVTGRYLVGCDGASSMVRRSLAIAWQNLGFDQDWLVVDLELFDRATSGLPELARQVCDPVRPTTLVSGHRDMYRFEFQIQPDEDAEQMQRPERTWELLAPWIGPRQARLVRAASYRFHAAVATSMHVGRVLLAGDAAHQMPPFMGQGLNSGLRDVFNLAWKLRWVLSGLAGDSLLDSYGIERIEHSTAVVHQSIDAGRLIDQYAGRSSHGITPSEGYGSDRPRPRYRSIVASGDHPAVGLPYPWWHEVSPTVTRTAEMVLVGSGQRPALPAQWPIRLHPSDDLRLTLGAGTVLVRPDGYVAEVSASD